MGVFMLGIFIMPKIAYMAVDPLLTETLATSTAMITDHRGPILTFIVGAFILVFIALLAKRGLFWASGLFGSIFRRK